MANVTSRSIVSAKLLVSSVPIIDGSLNVALAYIIGLISFSLFAL